MEIICKTSLDTEKVGRLLGLHSKSGDVFCLIGDLGAGKTLLCRGLAIVQGVAAEDVTSPTFTLMNVYKGNKLKLRHFDLYRLNSPEDLTDIGFYEYVGGAGITLIEWADLFAHELPETYLQINITVIPDGRKIILKPYGRRYVELLKEAFVQC